MGKIWFSSDWHINHKNIAGPKVSNWNHGFRNFSSTDEMNNHLFKTINDTVSQEDTIYFLGDFCFGGHTLTPKWRSEINCKTIHVCKGNHDLHIDKYKDCFTSVQDVLTVELEDCTFFMSHYSHQVWAASHKGVKHIFGHSHGSLEGVGRSMDVGIDAAYKIFGEYRPFSLQEVMTILDSKQIEFVDHHNSKTNR